MILPRWESLPQNMKNETVERYYKNLKKKYLSLLTKRCFDFIAALVMLVVLSPVLLVLSLLIKIDSKGPVFYRQTRVTAGNRDFRIFKFRTMVVDADKIGTLVTVDRDPRITNIGNKIRKYRLDELPQLLNIIKGEMSFVGTRPEVRKYVDSYSDEMIATLLLPAGVTSLASIKYKDEIIASHTQNGESIDETYIQYVLPQKMQYNIEYLKTFSFWGDIKLMLNTVISVVK